MKVLMDYFVAMLDEINEILNIDVHVYLIGMIMSVHEYSKGVYIWWRSGLGVGMAIDLQLWLQINSSFRAE